MALRTKIFSAFLAAALALLPQVALARYHSSVGPKKSGWSAVCPLDVQDYCKGVKSKKLRNCLLAHKKELSPRCAKAVEKQNPDDLF